MLCSSSLGAESLRAANLLQVDFSGSWELDYSKSDNVQHQLDSLVRELRRQQPQQSRGDSRGGPAINIGNSSGPNSAPSIIGLAQMAELLSQSTLLEIEQSERIVKVAREGDFALRCEFHQGAAKVTRTPVGTEICGWDGHQLLFSIILPEGLRIQHRLTLAPDGSKLQLKTTVVSDRVSSPFTLARTYNRYVPGSNGYSCKLTLTRGKVCSTESQ